MCGPADPVAGGETVFMNATAPESSELSECARGHVAYKPKRGDALMFYNVEPSYTAQDMKTMHRSCPVLDGVKWNAVKWIHSEPFRREHHPRSGLLVGACHATPRERRGGAWVRPG